MGDILKDVDYPTRRAGATVGAQIKSRRGQRGISAAELARQAGIGKASLSSIEAGRGNPTIDTLYAIAYALRIPLTDLLGEDDEDYATHHKANTPAPANEPSRELLRRITAGQSAEIWRLRMPPATFIEGVPHAAGTREYLLVAQGALAAGPQQEMVHLGPGDLLAFRGDSRHSYQTSDGAADVTVVLVSPSQT